jgi:hypothetical protein
MLLSRLPKVAAFVVAYNHTHAFILMSKQALSTGRYGIFG